jgi:hypothetical protein
MSIRMLHPDEALLPVIDQGREIFITYFTDLYKNISPTELGITDLDNYLDSIFEKTRLAIEQGTVHAFLLYTDGQPAGFAACSLLENSAVILIHTLPINLHYNHQAQEIRQHFFMHMQKRFSTAKAAIMLVRKANQAYRSFCETAGFIKNNQLFDHLEYVQKTYNSAWYDIYEYSL